MPRRRTSPMISQINVVPYLDVMLVLLVIFMATAPLFNQGTVDVPSVGADAANPAQSAALLITALPSGDLEWHDLESGETETFPREQLRDRAAAAFAAGRSKAVVLAVDKDSRYGAAMELVEELHRAGAHVGLQVALESPNN